MGSAKAELLQAAAQLELKAETYRRFLGSEAAVSRQRLLVAQTELDPTGLVLVEGENWTARTDGDRIERGGEVMVTAVEGLKLRVTRKTPGGG